MKANAFFYICLTILLFNCIQTPVITSADKAAKYLPSPVPIETPREEESDPSLTTQITHDTAPEAGNPAVDTTLPDHTPLPDVNSGLIPTQKPISFNIDEAIKQITGYFQAPEYPIVNKKKLFFIAHDLNADDIPEILVPGIESEKPVDTDLEHISSFSRLFDTEKAEIKFNIYIFINTNDTYTLFRIISLGYNQVFKSFIKFYGNSKVNDPVIFAATFQTEEGTLHKWVLFKKPVLKPISIFQFEETIFKQAVIKDIDDDGTIDVIIQEKSVEEGVGYETYLTWMKWNGKGFAEYKNVNVVRNLHTFLDKIEELLIKKDMNKLLSFAVDPQVSKALAKSGKSKEEILGEFLGLSRITAGNGLFELLGNTGDVVFPDILDNPFYLDDDKGYYFLLTYRLVFLDDISLIAETLLYMKKNPFGERQFMLMPENTQH